MDTYIPRSIPTQIQQQIEQAAGKYVRQDGRQYVQLRPTFMETGVIKHAVGSAYVENQHTKVICGVYGPRTSKKTSFHSSGKLICDLKYAPFVESIRRKRGQQNDERVQSQLLNDTLRASVQLDKLPKSVVEAYVVVLEADGSVLSTALTCASLALADAGIEMYDLVAATEAVYLNNTILLDPTASESQPAPPATGPATGIGIGIGIGPSPTSSLLVAYMPNLRQVTQLRQSGTIEDGIVQEMLTLCIDGCSKMNELMRSCLVQHAQRKLQEQQTETQEARAVKKLKKVA